MSTEIEVSFVGRDVREFLPWGPDSFRDRGLFYEDDNRRAWENRHRVTLSVGDDERLASVFDRAVETAGVYEADWTKHQGQLGYGTYRHIALRDDESPIPLIHRLTDRPVLIDEDGLAIWGRGLYGDATYGQLSAAAAAGAVPGDPTQIYLNVRLAPAGGEFFVDWEFVVHAWEVAYRVAEVLATAGGVVYLYEKVCDRLAGYRVVERRSEEWLRRNGHPDLFRETLVGEPWSPRVLAGLLGCTAGEAEQILALYGYESESSERWVYAGGNVGLGLPVAELSARVVTAYSTETRHKYPTAVRPLEDRLEELFRRILAEAVESGEVTELESDEYLRRFGRPD